MIKRFMIKSATSPKTNLKTADPFGYFSTNGRSAHVDFRQAVLNGQPEDRGLYFPGRIPGFSAEFWETFPQASYDRLAFEIIKPFVGETIPDDILFQICSETLNFEFPLVSINEKISALELFHGPTLAFKDVGARFMSRCLQHFTVDSSQKTIVIVATSGDTGGAVASGFYGVEGIEVVILYPKGKVSRIQELQLTTPGRNITAIEVNGAFDDCQTLAKTALADKALKKQVFVTSANSINVARWLPQQFYYFYALQQWFNNGYGANPVVCVPSGNFGNICAGLLAKVRGLPVDRFIAATNANDVIPNFFESGVMGKKPPVETLSNAMDVARPSNFVRILEIFENDFNGLRQAVSAVSVSDENTAQTMRAIYEKYGYILDPHGAVGYYALENYLEEHSGQKGFFLETAHPVKFDSVEKITGTFGRVPDSVKDLKKRPSERVEMEPEYDDLRGFLIGKV